MVLITIKKERRTDIIDSVNGTLEATVFYPAGNRRDVLIEQLDSQRLYDYLGHVLGHLFREQVLSDYADEGRCLVRKLDDNGLVLDVRIED